MTNIVDGLMYTQDGEWIKVEGDRGIVGVTDFAQASLSDIVYLELPDVGESYDMRQRFGVIESVKAAADLNMPVAGEVLEINKPLLDTPGTVNSDPYGKAWLIKIKLTAPEQLEELMDAEAYRSHCKARG